MPTLPVVSPRFSAFLALVVATLGPAAGARSQNAAVGGLDRETPNAERWLVQFESRSFTLDAFRVATRRGDAAALRTIVAGLERRVVQDQAPFVEAVEALGGRVVAQWWLVNACCIKVSASTLDAVRALPNVRRVEPDTVIHPLVKESTNASNHGSDMANAAGYNGRGVTAAIVDTGLDETCSNKNRPHRTFYPRGDLTKPHRLVANKQLGRMPADNANPHGTGVASIVAGGRWSSSLGDDGHAPLAGVAGYSIANNADGATTFQVITSAWQAVAADAARLGIKTANNSYAGSPDPTHTSQQALDSCAFNADVLIVVAAGHASTGTNGSQSCANGLAAAAVSANAHIVAASSPRGPLPGDPQRLYPDLSGVGVSRVMARADNESGDWVASGTSLAAPQVTGAATLIRAQNTAMRAVEAKAVLLASALDIGAKNPSLDRNAFGGGLVRSDHATALTGAGTHGTARLTPATPSWTRAFPTADGRSYRVAAAWMRAVTTSTAWANLDIEVLQGSTVVARAETPRNLYELTGFRSGGGSYTVRVTAKSFEAGRDVEFGWAFTEGAIPPVIGRYEPFGDGCRGTGKNPDGGPISPAAYATRWGERANYFPHGRANMRYQQLHAASDFAGKTSMEGIAFRLDDRVGGPAATKTIEFLLGYSDRTPATMSATFATNVKGAMTGVFRGQISWPWHGGGNTNLASFAVRVKFTRPFVYDPAGGSLLWEARNTSATSTQHYFDWATGSTSIPVRRVYATSSANATSGTRDGSHGGLVTRFLAPALAVPALRAAGVPEIGKTFDVLLERARPNTGAALLTGTSNARWGAWQLPLRLDPFGAPGCSLYVSVDLVDGIATDTAGAAKITIGVPDDRSLLGARLHHQFLILDNPPGNSLGLVWTNAATATIGGQP